MSEAMQRVNELAFAISRRLEDYREAVHAARLATQRARAIKAEIERLERRRDAARAEHLDGILGRVRRSEPLVSEAEPLVSEAATSSEPSGEGGNLDTGAEPGTGPTPGPTPGPSPLSCARQGGGEQRGCPEGS